MGEKPLSIDEAPLQSAGIVGGGPLGAVDSPPPGVAAAGINTTRSNIPRSGYAEPGGTAGPVAEGMAIKEQGVLKPAHRAAATGPVRPEPTNPDDPSPPSGPMGSSAGHDDPSGGTAVDGDPIPGIDVKLGKNPGGGAIGPVRPEPTNPGDPLPTGPGMPGGGGGDAQGASNPIPGVDIIVKKHGK